MKYLLILPFIVFAILCHAELPQTMSYQGVLSDNDGNPVDDGSYSVGFSIHNNPGTRNSGTRTQLWSETQTITVTNGQFRAILGTVNPLSLPFDEPYWLAVSINGSTLTPYSELTSVPFSFYSKSSVNADSLNGFAGSHYLDWGNLTNVPYGFADGTDASGSVLYDAVVATSGGDYTSVGAAIAAGKKTIYVRKGTYTNTSVVTLPDNTVIIGESWTESEITGRVLASSGKVTLRNVKITTTLGGMQAINFGGESVIDQVRIETTLNGGFYLGNQSHVTNSYISCGSYVTAGSLSCIENNFFYCQALNLTFGDRSRITGNYFQGLSPFANAAVYSGIKSVITNNIVICNASSAGVGISGQSGSVISSNRIEGFETGIALSVGQDGLTCSNNIVNSCGNTAFSVSSPTNNSYGPVTITGNVAWQPGGYGFRLDPSSHVNVSNNSVYGAGEDGFYIGTGVNIDLQINGNSARYCLGKGFNFSGGTYAHWKWSINSNQAIGNGSDGFCMYLQDATIMGNESLDNGGYGFYFPSGIQYSSFTGNNSCYNGAFGFMASGSPALSDTPITGNTIRDSFRISGQIINSVITGNVLRGDGNTFGSPQTNSIVDHNVQ